MSYKGYRFKTTANGLLVRIDAGIETPGVYPIVLGSSDGLDEEWRLIRAGVGLNLYAIQSVFNDSYASINSPAEEFDQVISSPAVSLWEIVTNEDRSITIRVPYRDLVWTLVSPIKADTAIILRPQNKKDEQTWELITVT